MAVDTKTRIDKLEREIRELWRLVSEDVFWHPSVIKEIKRRAKTGEKLLQNGKLRNLDEVAAGS